ncbi:MAG TPA: DUF58 domain-containing protein [Bacillota bacterium]
MRKSFRSVSRIAIVLLLFVVLFSYAMMQGGFTSWFLFYSFLPILLYPFALFVYPIRKWEVTRHIVPQVSEAGNEVTVVIHVERKIPFPLFYCISEDLLPETIHHVDCGPKKYYYLDQPEKLSIQRDSKTVSHPWFRRTFTLTYSLPKVPRGEHTFKKVRLKVGDLFGLLTKECSFPLVDQLVVYPDERPLQIVERVGSHAEGAVPASLVSSNQTNTVGSVREYVPGDKFSWIDWKQSANKNTLITKEFEQEKSADILIVLDGCADEKVNRLAFEGAVEITWSFIRKMSKQTAHVRFLSIADETSYFQIQHGSKHNSAIQQHLTRLRWGKRKQQSFAMRLGEEIASVQSMHVIIVTMNLNELLKDVIQEMRVREKSVQLIYIQSENKITKKDKQIIQQLDQQGVWVNLLTETQLMKHPVEVNV